MKRILTLIALLSAMTVPAMAQGLIHAGDTFLEALQKRDTALVADQFRYGIIVEGLSEGDVISLPELEKVFGDTLVLVRGWRLDTLGRGGFPKRKPSAWKLKADMIISPFEEGEYHLPDIPVLRGRVDGGADTLLYSGQVLEVCTMPVDMDTFEPHDLKPQMRYPLTLREVLPYVLWFQLAATLAILAACLVIMRRGRSRVEVVSEPPHITALKRLDRFRGDRYWAPDKQKAMYSGITDALRTYMESMFGINAEEMTTAEIFDALKGEAGLSADLRDEVKRLFELADFVKFAKHTASEEDNARAVPVAVSFVTSTYQSRLETETAGEGGDD